MATMQDYVGGAGLATGMVGWLAGWLAAGPVHGQAGGWRWKWLLVRSRARVLECLPAWPGWTIATLFPPSPTGRRLVFLVWRNKSGSALARVAESAGPQPLRTLLVTAPETRTRDGRGCWGGGMAEISSIHGVPLRTPVALLQPYSWTPVGPRGLSWTLVDDV